MINTELSPEQTEAATQKRISMDPEMRKKFRGSLGELTHYLQHIDDYRSGLKDSISAIAEEYGLKPKTIRKMATTMHKANYGSQQEERRQFEQLYEMVVEGKLREEDDFDDKATDPEDDDGH